MIRLFLKLPEGERLQFLAGQVRRQDERRRERRAQALYSGLTFGLGIVAGTALAGPLYATIGGRGSFLAAALFSCLVVLIWFPVRHRLAR